jgi:hypothetical protein
VQGRIPGMLHFSAVRGCGTEAGMGLTMDEPVVSGLLVQCGTSFQRVRAVFEGREASIREAITSMG